jgi:hypothetical protein
MANECRRIITSTTFGPTWITTRNTRRDDSLAVVILLLIFPILMTPNVKSLSIPPPFQLRVGKSLQVQHWLAIIGVEFSTLLGTFLLPKLSSILVSKYDTKRLMGSGLEWSTLLNSQQSAPFPTQFRHGMKGLLGTRLALPIFGVALSIAYKFSFENVSIEDTIRISNVALVEVDDFVGEIRFTYSVHDEPLGSSWAWGRDVDSFPKLNADIPRRPSFGVECHKFIAARSSSNMPSALLRSIPLFLFSYSFHRANWQQQYPRPRLFLGARLSSTIASRGWQPSSRSRSAKSNRRLHKDSYLYRICYCVP